MAKNNSNLNEPAVRFAPTPTGRFHLGNLRTAWVSCTLARAWGLPWHVRFDDIDPQRCTPEWRELQLQDLAELGMVPDILSKQTDHSAQYRRLWERAVAESRVYPCSCSRAQVQNDLAHAPHLSLVESGPGRELEYSGRCAFRSPEEVLAEAARVPGQWVGWRFRMVMPSHDVLVARSLASAEPGSSQWQWGYHWASSVDDALGGFALLVRAWDLAGVLPVHQAIGEWGLRQMTTGSTFPPVFHTTLLTREDEGRLEKRTRAVSWPELKEQGMTAERLLASFERSFRAPQKNEISAAPWGEMLQKMKVSSLGM